MKKSIKGQGNQHTSGETKANGVNQLDQKGVHPGMVVAVGDEAQNLFKLIETVGSHDARILVKEVGKPAQQAKEKSA